MSLSGTRGHQQEPDADQDDALWHEWLRASGYCVSTACSWVLQQQHAAAAYSQPSQNRLWGKFWLNHLWLTVNDITGFKILWYNIIFIT